MHRHREIAKSHRGIPLGRLAPSPAIDPTPEIAAMVRGEDGTPPADSN
jgi:hypothetical protein